MFLLFYNVFQFKYVIKETCLIQVIIVGVLPNRLQIILHYPNKIELK